MRRLRTLEPDLQAALESAHEAQRPPLLEGLAWLLSLSPQHERRIALAQRWPSPILAVRAAQSLRHLGCAAEAWARLEGVHSWEADRLRSILAREAGDYESGLRWLERGLEHADHDTVRAMLLANLAQVELARGGTGNARRG